MSNGEFLDDLMKQLYEAFGKPKGKPGAEENPPRNYYCAGCRQWFTTAHIIECGVTP